MPPAALVGRRLGATVARDETMHTRDMKLEMVRMLSATAALASGVSLGVGTIIVGVLALLS
jgi:hypothetical protein